MVFVIVMVDMASGTCGCGVGGFGSLDGGGGSMVVAVVIVVVL